MTTHIGFEQRYNKLVRAQKDQSGNGADKGTVYQAGKELAQRLVYASCILYILYTGTLGQFSTMVTKAFTATTILEASVQYRYNVMQVVYMSKSICLTVHGMQSRLHSNHHSVHGVRQSGARDSKH
jgi:hypothetical protein